MRQYVSRPGIQEWANRRRQAGTHLVDGMMLSILMVGAVKPGYASMKKWCLRCLLKIGNVEAEEIWVGSLFQTRDAADEKDFEVAIDDFLNDADMVIEKEDWVIVKVCILEELEQGTNTTGGAVPWKQLWQLWNWLDGVQGASAGQPKLAWCGSTETFVQQLEQGCIYIHKNKT